MISGLKQNYGISNKDLKRNITKQLSNINIQLDIDRKRYNLKNINELLKQQKLLNKLLNKINNNQEVYFKDPQLGGSDCTWCDTDENLQKRDGSKCLIILDLQSVIKNHPNGKNFIEEDVLIKVLNKLSEDKNNGIIHVISDDFTDYNRFESKYKNISTYIKKKKFS